MAGKILVGTSSWADPGFVKEWYPPKMAAGERLLLVRGALRVRRAQFELLRRARSHHRHRWAEQTPDGFVFDVKAHRLLSRHWAPLDSLPPDLRERAETSDRGRVRLTPELEAALASRLLEETAPLAEAGKARVLPPAADARLLAAKAPARGARRSGRCAGRAGRCAGAAQSRLGRRRAPRRDARRGLPTVTWPTCASTRRPPSTSRSCPRASTP